MILGVGLDLCPIERMQLALERSGGRFSLKVFTEAERAYCSARGQPAQHFAARFAAKEAVLKALGVPSGLSWHELEVVTTAGGAPELRLSGVAATLAAERGIRRLHLSLTHSGNMAAAVVILEGGPLVASL